MPTGIYVRSKKYKEKMRDIMVGKKKSKKHAENISLGKKGIMTWDIRGDKNPAKRLDIRKKISESKQKEKHPNWKGGKTPLYQLLKANSKWKIWRELVFLRDNFICQNKDCKFCHNKMGRILHPHHIIQLKEILKNNNIQTLEEALNCKELWNINNGITYCAEFHLKSGLHSNLQLIKLKEVIKLQNIF